VNEIFIFLAENFLEDVYISFDFEGVMIRTDPVVQKPYETFYKAPSATADKTAAVALAVFALLAIGFLTLAACPFPPAEAAVAVFTVGAIGLLFLAAASAGPSRAGPWFPRYAEPYSYYTPPIYRPVYSFPQPIVSPPVQYFARPRAGIIEGDRVRVGGGHAPRRCEFPSACEMPRGGRVPVGRRV